MTWLQIKIKTTAEWAEQISERLQQLGSLAVTFQDAGDEPLYEPPLDEIVIWKEVLITALFPAETDRNTIIEEIKNLSDKTLHYSLETLQDEAWDKAWMSNFQPMQFGQRLWILPSYLPVQDLPACHVILDPGLAFGTGTHPTTALCLEWLDQHLQPNTAVIDYGCGSGILAIAALKLGASKVWAVDHDPQALQATKENAKQNHIEKATLQLFLPEELPQVHADLLIANILANPLIELAKTFHALLKKNGIIVLSGILVEQINAVREEYEKFFTILQIDVKDEWARIVGVKYHSRLSH